MAEQNMTQVEKDTQYEKTFTRSIIRYGRLTNLLAIPLCFIPAITIALYYGAMPTVREILSGWFLIASVFGIFAIVEPVSFFPILGLPGTYMSFLAGNIGNMRVPCSAIAQEAVGVVPGSKKAELVSTLGIAGSIITNLVITTIAAVGGAAIITILPPVVLEAFRYVSTGIFAATFAMYFVKKPVLGVFALAVCLIMLLAIPGLPTFAIIPAAVFSTIAFGFFLNSRKAGKA